MVRKVEKRIGKWCNRWLTLGGKFFLVKSILENIPVYRLSLPRIPISILGLVRRMIFSFLWLGSKDKDRYHLVSRNNIARPKDYGGWGFENTFYFGNVLASKILWRGLFLEGLRTDVIKDKYLKYRDSWTGLEMRTNVKGTSPIVGIGY